MKNIILINLTNQIKNIILLQMIIKKFISVPVIILILQFIKMKQENKDILIDIRRMRIGMIKIQLGLGRVGCYGIYQQ